MGSVELTNWLLITLIAVQVWIHLHRFYWLQYLVRKISDFLNIVPAIFLLGWMPAVPALWIGFQNIRSIENDYYRAIVVFGLLIGIFVTAIFVFAIVAGLWGRFRK